MELLRRYQKSGGFLQLVQLIETCAPAKKAQLLDSVEKESRRWAKEVRNKMLSIERIFSWKQQPLGEVISSLQKLTLSIVIHDVSPENREKIINSLSHTQKRDIDQLAKTKKSTQGEITSAYMKIISEVREMINQGYVHLQTVDPGLIIEDDIEDKLSKQTFSEEKTTNLTSATNNKTSLTQPTPQPVASTKESKGGLGKGVLEMELAKLRQENQRLKQQIQTLNSELSSTRKVVAQVKKAVA